MAWHQRMLLAMCLGLTASLSAADTPGIVLPLERTAYFAGERVPLLLSIPPSPAPPREGVEGAGEVTLQAVNADGPTLLYRGKPGIVMLDTSRLAPGDYRLDVGGQPAIPRFTVVSMLRRSCASLQDESAPSAPQFDGRKKYTPQERAEISAAHWDGVARTLQESGISTVFSMATDDTGPQQSLDTLARSGTIMLCNPETRPTSFNPTRNAPEELDSMSQRLILAAQANGRYPNFGGFCYGWDTCGYAVGGRRGLLIYWGWGKQEQALRNYIQRIDQQMMDIFRKRTGMEPAAESEYIAYVLSLKRPEFGTMIDLPTKAWLEELAPHTALMPEDQRAQFEKRLDAWSSYLMGMYDEVYGTFNGNLHTVSPSFRATSSVQVDHAAVRQGQYFPSAYSRLDFRYQSTWNDQIGGPDYAYQWLLTAGLLGMGQGERPTWLSNAIAAAHGRAAYPGKFTRVAAHGLAWRVSGIGFACEAFSNLLGGMNKDTNWVNMKGRSGQADVLAGREFLERFAGLALNGRGDHGAGILFSKSQFARQHVTMGFGEPRYKVFVALARLGYTPRFITEEELAFGGAGSIKALVVVGQTFPILPDALAAVERFVKSGGKVLVDGNTTVAFPAAQRFEADLPFTQTGKPFNWAAPNMPAGDNDTLMYARWYQANAPKLAAALGSAGRGLFTAASGALSPVSLMQIDGGADARYVVAVNDSHIATQADWYQVREKLTFARDSAIRATVTLYDLNEEKVLGPAGALDCDLTATTARVYGWLNRPMASIALSARQELRAGEDLILAVRFCDKYQGTIQAVIPMHIALRRPDGKLFQDFHRATERDGTFAMSIPLPANIPAGEWRVSVRCQLEGSTASLPVNVAAAQTVFATAYEQPVIVRGRKAIEPLLKQGQRVVVPIFDSPQAGVYRAAAEKVKAALGPAGVEIVVRDSPSVSLYILSYDPSDEEKAENAKAEKGESFGKIVRKTTNRNDWFAALSGWHFGLPVILLDLAGAGDNPPVKSLSSAGLLWPRADAAFPGPGRAVLHGVHWAFAPRANAIVIQASDERGLMAGAEALAKLPEDLLSSSVAAARERLWAERRIGGGLPKPAATGLTAAGLRTEHAPQPLRMEFPEQKPPTAEQAAALAPKPPQRAAIAIPASINPRKQLVPFIRQGDGRLVEASAAEVLVPDLRFSNGLFFIADVQQPGKTRITVTGTFRYSDRLPRTQPQWEDILKLYDQLVPKRRQPMEVEVQAGGKLVGKLVPSRTEQREVPLETKPGFGDKELKKAVEEVVTELSGEADLPGGRQEVLLVHKNIVDGMVEGLGVGRAP